MFESGYLIDLCRRHAGAGYWVASWSSLSPLNTEEIYDSGAGGRGLLVAVACWYRRVGWEVNFDMTLLLRDPR